MQRDRESDLADVGVVVVALEAEAVPVRRDAGVAGNPVIVAESDECAVAVITDADGANRRALTGIAWNYDSSLR